MLLTGLGFLVFAIIRAHRRSALPRNARRTRLLPGVHQRLFLDDANPLFLVLLEIVGLGTFSRA